MKHRTLRCAAETLVLLLIAAMAVSLPPDCISARRTGRSLPSAPAGTS